jgi:rubrerythrin
MMPDAEPAVSVFTKDDLKCANASCDPEFDNLDNSVDFEPEIMKVSAHDETLDNCRKSIPAEMTLEELVEAMEANEDTVECVICEELFPKADGVKHGHGYICPTCNNIETTENPFDQEFSEPEDDVVDKFSEMTVGRAVADLIVDEFEAISGYDAAVETIQNTKIPKTEQVKILDTIDHIRKEEEEHIDELKAITLEDKVLDEDLEDETVECAGCEETFPKDECFYKDDIGWLCGDCEDTIVKCTWCEELYDKGECRYEVDLGWLCDRCEAAIKSRGETLTFKEGSYWDFLDEDITTELHDLGNEYDGGYPTETPEVSDSHLKLCPECGKERFDPETGICIDCGFN